MRISSDEKAHESGARSAFGRPLGHQPGRSRRGAGPSAVREQVVLERERQEMAEVSGMAQLPHALSKRRRTSDAGVIVSVRWNRTCTAAFHCSRL